MIDYNLISSSINYYENNNFYRIESPWTVSEYVDKLTKPNDAISFQLKHNNKCLVASGEQSFLYLYLKEFIPKGQFQTTTPCFRYESFDFTHTKYFLKNELIKTDVVNDNELNKITEICFNFFKKYISDIYIKKTDIGFDIEYNGIEIGSYGIRENQFLKWIYATGCAEPRFSKIINLYKNGLS
jgi:hypothetical protein